MSLAKLESAAVRQDIVFVTSTLDSRGWVEMHQALTTWPDLRFNPRDIQWWVGDWINAERRASEHRALRHCLLLSIARGIVRLDTPLQMLPQTRSVLEAWLYSRNSRDFVLLDNADMLQLLATVDLWDLEPTIDTSGRFARVNADRAVHVRRAEIHFWRDKIQPVVARHLPSVLEAVVAEYCSSVRGTEEEKDTSLGRP